MLRCCITTVAFALLIWICAEETKAQTPSAPPLAVEQNALDDLRARIVSAELPNVHSVLVVQDGRTLAAWYFAGEDAVRGRPAAHVVFDAETLHDVRSVTKSIVSLLFGIALRDGAVKSLDEPVLNYFPEHQDLRTPDRMRIRVRDLLSMTSGLAWDEDTLPYSDPRNSETAMDRAPDRHRFALEQPIVSAPGTAFRYSGGDVAVLAAIISRATGTPLDLYAEQKLFEPLGIEKYQWLKDRDGVPIAASGLRLLPRDMVKLGQMMLDHGKWDGQDVVPADWVAASTTLQARVQPDSTCGTGYGYFWWLAPGCDAEPPTPWFVAIGNGGQRIAVAPSRKLVVVLTMGHYNDPVGRRTATEILRGILSPATVVQ